jgi:hypothetical protein
LIGNKHVISGSNWPQMLLIPLAPVSIITSTVRLCWGYKHAVTLAPPPPCDKVQLLGKIFEFRQKDFLVQIIHHYVHRTTSYSLFCFNVSHMLNFSVFCILQQLLTTLIVTIINFSVSILHYVFTWRYRQKTEVFWMPPAPGLYGMAFWMPPAPGLYGMAPKLLRVLKRWTLHFTTLRPLAPKSMLPKPFLRCEVVVGGWCCVCCVGLR